MANLTVGPEWTGTLTFGSGDGSTLFRIVADSQVNRTLKKQTGAPSTAADMIYSPSLDKATRAAIWLRVTKTTHVEALTWTVRKMMVHVALAEGDFARVAHLGAGNCPVTLTDGQAAASGEYGMNANFGMVDGMTGGQTFGLLTHLGGMSVSGAGSMLPAVPRLGVSLEYQTSTAPTGDNIFTLSLRWIVGE
jgi:hypothetical protein